MEALRDDYDIVIIGGGINGVGIARDAAGRGLKVLLCEKGDLASATSSASSKLIHGGLRYLEHGEFSLVRKALSEREQLINIAPHLISPLEFCLPQNQYSRHRLLLRLGLFFYDILFTKSRLPRSRSINIKTSKLYFQPLRHEISHGFCYYDCQVDDARLVIANALSAKNLGAQILTRTAFVSARRDTEDWKIKLLNQDKQIVNCRARCVINAAGAWVNQVNEALTLPRVQAIQWIKGSHIVVRKQYEGDHAYILQQSDKRIVFIIPYYNDYTLIGTTDVAVNSPDTPIHISQEEIDYLCTAYNDYFKAQLQAKDIVNHWSGVRTLPSSTEENPSEITRDYKLVLENTAAPAISIYGGKITTYRVLAEEVMEQLKPYFSDLRKHWTHTQALTGGDMTSLEAFEKKFQKKYPWLEADLQKRYSRSYGTQMERLLSDCHSMADLGKNLGDSIYTREIDYLIKEEWAHSTEDILWRRGKIGLFVSPKTVNSLTKYLKNKKIV